MEQCSGCRFWLNWDSEMTNLGECHRFPPRMETARRTDGDEEVLVTIRPADGGWPLTAPEDWCGEYQHPLTLPPEGPATATPRNADIGPAGI
jgi:hypothetical protein